MSREGNDMDRLILIWDSGARDDAATSQSRIVADSVPPRVLSTLSHPGAPTRTSIFWCSHPTIARPLGQLALVSFACHSAPVGRTQTPSLPILMRGIGGPVVKRHSVAEVAMTRCYSNPDPDHTSTLTQGNVVFAIRDFEAEKLGERQRWPRAVSDVEFCNYIEYLFIVCGRQNNFRAHPEYKQGIEIRCQNQGEAEYLDRLMWDRYTTVVKYNATYFG
jgi:hypothetical protein